MVTDAASLGIDVTKTIASIIGISVILAALGQVLLKAGMSVRSVQVAAQSGTPVQFAIAVVTSWLVWVGLVVFGLSVLTWLVVLSKVEVSTAYPFAALGMVLTATLGYLAFGESMGITKIAGIALICMGVILVARGA